MTSDSQVTGDKPVVLVVDDDSAVLSMLGRVARREGYEVLTCGGGREALERMGQARIDLVVVDLMMPDVGGLEVIKAIRDANQSSQIVIMSGQATIDSAVEAVKLGARDYLTKPFDLHRLRDLLGDIKRDVSQLRDRLAIESDLAQHLNFQGMIGRGPAMQELFDLIRRLAPHVRTALITGETGTGKELVARALHQVGPRRDRKFITINCSAVVETLFESELFGHVRGAFTGATDNKVGMFELANGGTLFMDEVGELPAALQAKLLRTLEVGEVQRVGSLDQRKVDVRVIAATNRDLVEEVQRGQFRSDLYYRLNIVEIRLPPLRERSEDIPYLTAAFVRELAKRFRKPLVGVTPAAERLLVSAPWDGNVRELKNVIERACMLASGDLVTERELSDSLAQQSARAVRPLAAPMTGVSAPAGPSAPAAQAASDQGSLKEIEREHVERALKQTGGNKAAAARMLGLSRRAFYRRLERHGLAAPPTPNAPPGQSDA
jgi:DNA-binding NtrC family response regulator